MGFTSTTLLAMSPSICAGPSRPLKPALGVCLLTIPGATWPSHILVQLPLPESALPAFALKIPVAMLSYNPAAVLSQAAPRPPASKLSTQQAPYISSTGTITTSGAAAHGIYVDLAGATTVSVGGTIAAGGSGSDGVQLKDVGTAAVDISGSVSGGSGTGAGLRLSSLGSADTPTVAIRGSLGALSDIAIVDGNGSVTINNSGTMTGIVSLGSGDDVLNNESNGTWYLRSGDNAAVADFGSGTDSVVNNGTLSQLKGTQLSWQGSLTNLESFTNSGTIDLADGHAGDTLSISGNFVSNGGTLKVDTVLDDGATPQTDMLQLDTVTTSSGPTHIQIENVGGRGGQTSGNGIQIIDVVTSSVSDAFDLAKRRPTEVPDVRKSHAIEAQLAG